MGKLKVAWICHFSNSEIRARLPLTEMKLRNWINALLERKRVHGFSDFSPWITNLIKEFEKFRDVELHVISPHHGLKYFTYEFEINMVHYHFYQSTVPIIHIPYNSLKIGGKYSLFLNRYYVKNFIKKIKPDIVNLIGAENPYYSITALDVKNIPVYVSVQTVYSNPNRKIYSDSYHQLHWDVERMIHKKAKYYGCSGRMHRDLILNNHPHATIFKMFFPLERPEQVKALPKIYDFVFFAAGVTKQKGIEDAIAALAIVKKEKNDVTLNVVGRCALQYKTFLINKIKASDLENNIVFNDYFPAHSDMHQHIVQSRFSLLPIKLDVIPGTVIEAIMLDLPVVTYKTTGTPYLNKDGESVLLADIGDIKTLAEQMIKLLNSPALANKISANAKAFVEKEFDNTASAKRLLSNYRVVIEHSHNNVPIPDDQLFSTDEFPLY